MYAEHFQDASETETVCMMVKEGQSKMKSQVERVTTEQNMTKSQQ